MQMNYLPPMPKVLTHKYHHYFCIQQLLTPVVNQAAVFTVAVLYGMDHTVNVRSYPTLATVGHCFLEERFWSRIR